MKNKKQRKKEEKKKDIFLKSLKVLAIFAAVYGILGGFNNGN